MQTLAWIGPRVVEKSLTKKRTNKKTYSNTNTSPFALASNERMAGNKQTDTNTSPQNYHKLLILLLQMSTADCSISSVVARSSGTWLSLANNELDYGFLFALYSTYGHIFCHFWDIESQIMAWPWLNIYDFLLVVYCNLQLYLAPFSSYFVSIPFDVE